MLVWTNDIHLNFLTARQGIKRFVKYLIKENPKANGLIIVGDISSGEVIEDHLRQLSDTWTKPLYFVLGNHSYYNASWESVDNKIRKLTQEIPHLHWLNEGFHEINNHVICGCGGWYDVYNGNYNSTVQLNDFILIEELINQNKYRPLLIDTIRKRANFEANILAKHLQEVCRTDNEVIIVCTHVPPYLNSSWHNGHISDKEWAPWFTSASTGKVLDKFSDIYSNKKFIVLTGHTHSSGIYQRSDNITVYTGSATYGDPGISGVINTKERKLWAFGCFGDKIQHKY